MRARFAIAGVAALVCFAFARESRAQSGATDAAHRALEARAWPAAVEAFERVLQDRSAQLPDVVEAHRALAWARFELGDAPAAEHEATEALAFDPLAEPPPSAPPGLRAIFERVRQLRQGARAQIELALAGPLLARRTETLHVRVSGLPAGDTARVSARCVSDGHEVSSVQLAAVGDGQYDAPLEALAPGSPLDCDARIATRTGVVIDRRALHLVAQAQTRPVVSIESHGPNGWLVAGMITSAVTVAAAVVVGFALSSGGSSVARLGTPTVTGP